MRRESEECVFIFLSDYKGSRPGSAPAGFSADLRPQTLFFKIFTHEKPFVDNNFPIIKFLNPGLLGGLIKMGLHVYLMLAPDKHLLGPS